MPSLRSAILLALLLLPAATLKAQGWPQFKMSREFNAQSKPAPANAPDSVPPRQPAEPWGLWASRAPYPYYEGFFGMDTDDDVVARDLQIDFQTGLWLAPGEHRGAYVSARAHIGLFVLDFKFTQAARFGHSAGLIGTNRIKDFADIVMPVGHLGVAWPIAHLGYIEGAIGVGAFDQTRGPSSIGVSFRASALIYPLWPLGLEAWASRLQFVDSRGVNEFGLRLHIQTFRHLFITAGWQWMNVDGSGFGAHGFTLGLSFTFGNLRTFFWAPMRGPAY
ncbi:hypothetical protein EDM80_05120 [bacterium]|nr:MAG: hypothetical protein EDM80_05120 [bacterium]RIK61823.1 MAG: hypothetical protein DCC64_12305 [Planctomycetota bacterium]